MMSAIFTDLSVLSACFPRRRETNCINFCNQIIFTSARVGTCRVSFSSINYCTSSNIWCNYLLEMNHPVQDYKQFILYFITSSLSDLTICSPVKVNRQFGRTSRLHIQD
jgi:hypothetical protein